MVYLFAPERIARTNSLLTHFYLIALSPIFKLGAKSKEASALQEMVNKLQEERVSAATAAESVKRRTGQIERNFDQLETEKLGLDRSVFLTTVACCLHFMTSFDTQQQRVCVELSRTELLLK